MSKKLYRGTTPLNAVTSATNEELMSVVLPVGFCYTQLPNKKLPWELWTFITEDNWENISSEFAGDFFRVEGGNAQTFDTQTVHQGAQLPNVTGQVGQIYMGADNSAATGTFTRTSSGSKRNYTVDSGSTNSWDYVDMSLSNANSTYVGNGEVRPCNWTVRIWQRI